MQNRRASKTIRKRSILIISLLVAVIVFLGLMQHYVMARLDAHQRRIQGFYMEEKDSLDMVLVGSSEIYNGFVPAKAWEEYGVTSYLYGYQADPATLWKYQLREIERTQDPDVLIFECNSAGYGKDNLENPAEVRFMTDDMPFSKNKIDLINEKGTESKLSYYFPFLKYHGHLIPGYGTKSKILLERRGFHILRGAQARVDGVDVSGDMIDVTGDESVESLDPLAEETLRAFLEECQQSDIEHIVFCRFPHVVTEETYDKFQRYHAIREIVQEYGFDYIDFDRCWDEMGLTVQDFLDSEHMNVTGAIKCTEYITPYIMDKYQLTPREQSAQNVAEWDESAAYFNDLYAYWKYFKETYPDLTSDNYDLNDNWKSNERIMAYAEGHPIDIRHEQSTFISKMIKKFKSKL